VAPQAGFNHDADTVSEHPKRGIDLVDPALVKRIAKVAQSSSSGPPNAAR